MNQHELVSIIVPVHNAFRFLPDTVESVIQQTYPDWELILVDDFSTDNSKNYIVKAAQRDQRIRPVFLEKNQGAAAARNIGLMEARGRYLAFLDADDLWHKDKLAKELSFIKQGNAAFIFCGYEFADESGKGLGKVVHVPKALTYSQALKNTTIFTSTVLVDLFNIPKELLRMPDVKSEDTATWWNILRHGFTAYGLNENLVLYRRSQGTLSSDKTEAIRRIWNLYRAQEKLSLLSSCYNFLFYAVRAVLRRI